MRPKRLLPLAYIAVEGAVAFTSTSSCVRYIDSHHPSTSQLNSAIDRGYETPINIEETAHRDISSFEEWAYNYGIQRDPGFQLTTDDGYDYYAITTQDLAAGQPVLCVPEQLILSSNKAMAELRTNDMDQAEKILYSVNGESEIRQYYLMVKILVEYEKGEESPWFPWLNS